MSRFYKTATPNFVSDFMYQPPWELAMQSMAVNEQGIETSLQKAELFKDLDIKYLDDPVERERVEKIKGYYTGKADEISAAIQKDPMNWRSFGSDISKFGRELKEDLTTGDLSKIQSSHQAYQNWVTENAELKKSDPGLYNQLLSKFTSDWQSNENRSLDSSWQGQQGIARPKLEWEKVANLIKADSTPMNDGTYMYQNKRVTEGEIQDIAWNRLKSDPNFVGYINQMGNTLGQKEYFENPFELRDSTGQVITQDQYQNMDIEAKKQLTRHLNPNNPFSSDLAMATGISAFSQSEYKGMDPVAKAKMDQAMDMQKLAVQHANSMNLANFNQGQQNARLEKTLKAKSKEDIDEYRNTVRKVALSGTDAQRANAEKILQSLDAKITLGQISYKDITYEQNANRLKTNKYDSIGRDPVAVSIEEQATEYARDKVKFEPQSWQDNFTRFIDGRINSNGLGESGSNSLEAYTKEYLKSTGESDLYTGSGNDSSTSGVGAKKALEHKNKQIVAYSKVANQYINNKKEYIDKHYNVANAQVAVHPLSIESGKALKDIITSNPNTFYSTDEKGNPIEASIPTDIVDIRAFGGTNQGNVGFEVQGSDGKKVMVFPNHNITSLEKGNMNEAILSGLPTNSPLAKELMAPIVNNLATFMNNSGVEPGTGNKVGVPSILGQKVPLRMLSNGQVEVRNPSTGAVVATLNDLTAVVEELQKWNNE